jgi:hypothetical protein
MRMMATFVLVPGGWDGSVDLATSDDRLGNDRM